MCTTQIAKQNVLPHVKWSHGTDRKYTFPVIFWSTNFRNFCWIEVRRVIFLQKHFKQLDILKYTLLWNIMQYAQLTVMSGCSHCSATILTVWHVDDVWHWCKCRWSIQVQVSASMPTSQMYHYTSSSTSVSGSLQFSVKIIYDILVFPKFSYSFFRTC